MDDQDACAINLTVEKLGERTLSFRVENNDNIFNSQKFEAGVKTSSILDVSSSKLSKSNNSTSNKGVESLPFNDSCVITPMDSMDPHEEETTSILEVSSSTLPENTNNSTSSNDYLPFNDSCVIRLSSSEDPYGNIKKSMERMVEANQGIKSWEESLEEICAWYLEINDEKNIHKHIIGAFCDLWMIYSSTSTKNTPFGFSSSEPPSPYFMSLIEDKADRIIAASISSVIP
ncbi:transcription repressor OFP13-like [Solanum stenotomum]|uniref:transcription repressor OFP13-like n=1 Tax=Solanum stenotomum TaxID=172797 RepID=UPI0020D13C9B|nr:transcription repressor OFP13-like [Solanum stenotomum]